MKGFNEAEREILKRNGDWKIVDTILVENFHLLAILIVSVFVGFLIWAEFDHQLLSFIWKQFI